MYKTRHEDNANFPLEYLKRTFETTCLYNISVRTYGGEWMHDSAGIGVLYIWTNGFCRRKMATRKKKTVKAALIFL